MQNAKAEAALYLLTGLIQRVSEDNPAVLNDMLEGAKADQKSMSSNVKNKEFIDEIFKESISILERIKGLESICVKS